MLIVNKANDIIEKDINFLPVFVSFSICQRRKDGKISASFAILNIQLAFLSYKTSQPHQALSRFLNKP